MIDFASLYIICGLFIVIIAEFVFLMWTLDKFSKEKDKLLEELARSNRALISRNANDYVMTASIDKVIREEKKAEAEQDEISEDELSDKEWFKAMGMEKPENPSN